MSNVNEATLIFPHQLFKQHPALFAGREIFLVEDQRFFSDFNFHTMKLVMHRASMKFYYDYLTSAGHPVMYVDYTAAKNIWDIFKEKKIARLHYADVVDHVLQDRILAAASDYKIELVVYQSPMFLTSLEDITTYFASKKSYLMYHFYVWQRKRLGILVDGNKPVGGRWTFDDENRSPAPEDLVIPKIKKLPKNKYVLETIAYVEEHFKNNPGSLVGFNYPVTFDQAESWFDDFLVERFQQFGPYQDAIIAKEHFLFHSVISSACNTGLLTPDYIVEKTLAYAAQHKIPINSLEGFIRQIIGWREFVRAIYVIDGRKQASSNFFGYTKKLSAAWYDGSTGLEPIDTTIKKVLTSAYAHHIERLMILGNGMLLAQIQPDEVYRWFMELFIDAYDWVMVPNVYGMSQYADGGLMTTKPYVSSSHYITTMSDYKKDSWVAIWDALFWNFLYQHRQKLADNNRLRYLYATLKRMNHATLTNHKKIAADFLK